MIKKSKYLLLLLFGIFLLGCQQQYAYRSKVRINKQEVVKAKDKDKEREREREGERERRGEREGEERVEREEITASEGSINILPYLPKIQLDFGIKKYKRDTVVSEFREEYKSLKQKFPKSESSAKSSNFALFVGIAILFLSILLIPNSGLIAVVFALFGLMIIIFNLLGRHKLENKELIERKKAYRKSTEGVEAIGLKYRRILSLVFMFLTLLSLFAFTGSTLVFAYMLFAGPALLGAGIVGNKLDIDHKDEAVQIIAIIIGAAATIFLVLLLFYLALLSGSLFYPLLLLALALLLFFIGRELAKIHSPKSY